MLGVVQVLLALYAGESRRGGSAAEMLGVVQVLLALYAGESLLRATCSGCCRGGEELVVVAVVAGHNHCVL
jgi:hypothetical protein